LIVTLVQIVPGAPPLVNGVADFAFVVARALERDFGIGSVFLVCNPAWQGSTRIEGFGVMALRSRRREAFSEALRQAAAIAGDAVSVLLQLSPYGFDQNGSPFWLAGGLADWKRSTASAPRLITYFHELYATSAPWRRGFWLSPLQRSCARRVLRLTDIALTNTERYRERLVQWEPSRADRVATLPVVSGIGEPSEILPLEKRLPQLVVWGSAHARRGIYEGFMRELENVIRVAKIKKVIDIGPPCTEMPGQIARASVHCMGVVVAEQLSAALSKSMLGVMAYNPNYLAKSSLFAAFCAHGIPALVLPTHPREQRVWDELRHGQHFLTAEFANADGEPAAVELGHVAGQARAWYQSHNAAAHARLLACLLADSVRGLVPRHASS